MKSLCLWLIVLSFFVTITAGAADVVNGDFETGDFTGWMSSGHVNVVDEATYQANGGTGTWPEGTYAANFNGGDSVPDATLSQSIPTIVGLQYELNFQFGAFSPQAIGSQTIGVEIRDTSTGDLLASTTVTDSTPSSDLSSLLEDQSLKFTAGGSSTTIDFIDQSLDTISIDGVLDNVSLVGEIFSDGFESGDTSAWSSTVP